MCAKAVNVFLSMRSPVKITADYTELYKYGDLGLRTNFGKTKVKYDVITNLKMKDYIELLQHLQKLVPWSPRLPLEFVYLKIIPLPILIIILTELSL